MKGSANRAASAGPAGIRQSTARDQTPLRIRRPKPMPANALDSAILVAGPSSGTAAEQSAMATSFELYVTAD